LFFVLLFFTRLRLTAIFVFIAFVVNFLLFWLAIVFVGLALGSALWEQIFLLYRLLLLALTTGSPL